METGSQILNYTGSKELGQGSNPNIPVIDPHQNLDIINSTARDIQLLNHADNIKLYEQKIKDRDTTLDLLASGQIASGDIDPNDRKYYDAAKKTATEKFYDMIKNGGLNNPDAVRKYYDAVTELKNTAVLAQHNQIEYKKLEQERAQQTLPEDIAAYDNHIKAQHEKPFGSIIDPYQKAFDYNLTSSQNEVLGLPTTESQLAQPDIQNNTGVTQWNSVTDKNGVITNKTTTKTTPVRSGLVTNTKGGKGITTTGTQVNKDGSLSPITYTPEKYWDLPTIQENVMDLSVSNPKARYTYEKYITDFQSKISPQQQLETLVAKNNRLAQYSQQRGLEKPEQIKYTVDPSGKILIQETPESFFAKTALASVNGDYVEKPKPEVDYKILENNTRLKIERENRASAERINANNIAKDKYIANLPYEKQKLGALGANGQPIDFGNLIYGVKTQTPINIANESGEVLKNVTINNGVVIDSKGDVVNYSGDVRIPAGYLDNSMITEFNKYSGTTKLGVNGEVLSSPSTSKLIPDSGGKFNIRMQNGEIQGIEANDGTFVSAQQMQHITMEAGQKGATKYHKADVNYGKFDKNKKVDEFGVPIQ